MSPNRRAHLSGPAAVLLVSLAVTGVGCWHLWLGTQERDAERFSREAAHIRELVLGRFDAVIALLDATAGLVAATAGMQADDLHAFVTPVDIPRRYPGIRAIGWALRVPAADRDAFVRTMRAEGMTDLDLGVDPVRDEFHPIVALETIDGAIAHRAGDDMGADAGRRAMLERSRDAGAAAVSALGSLPPAPGAPARQEILVVAPVYSGERTPQTVEERRARLLGFAFASIDAHDFFSALVGSAERATLDFSIHDGPRETQDSLLFRHERPPGLAAQWARVSTRGVIEFGGQKWTIAVSGVSVFEPWSHARPVLAALAGGVLASLLLAASVWARARMRSSAERFASALTQSRHELAQHRKLFSAALGGIRDAVVLVDGGGRVLDLNAAAQSLTGWSLDEAEGAAIGQIFATLDESTRQLQAKLDARTLDGQQVVDLPDHTVLIARGGGERPIEGELAPVRDQRERITGFVLIFRDISERRHAEKALRQSDERFHFLSEVLPQKIFTARPDGEMDYFSRQWAEFTGLPFAEIKGSGWKQFVHPDDLGEHLRRWRHSLDSGEPFLFEHRIRRADGSYRWHLSCARAMHDAHGKLVLWIGSNTDVDDIKRAEQQRAELLDRERELRAQSEAANRAKDEFLATLSHELRTPLNAILGWTQTLLKGNTRKDTFVRALTQIEDSAKAQARLIDDLLNVSDIVAGRLRLEVKPMRLTAAIEAAVESLHPAIDAKGITLEGTLDPAADAITGDAVRLQQVVWNLLSNAVKFTPRGGTIRLTLAKSEQEIELTVADNGEGISPEFLPYVFKRFRQADASSKRRHGGLGLGLAIVRHLVEMHGGTVAAASAGRGQGACFTVRLPISAPRPPVQPAPAVAPVVTDAATLVTRRPRLTGLRILSVDDDGNTREMLQEAFERAGATVMSAASAPEAIAVLQRFRPDVFVSDIGLPEQDGYSLLRQVRSLPEEHGGATPAVAITGYAREQDRIASLKAGYQAFTPKPVDLDELFALIVRVAKRAN